MIEAWTARCAGLALVGFSAIGWISIITWSNLDPSLTHTTAEPTRNLLGPLGAIVSDLLLQTLGICALLVLGGPLVWGLELCAARRVPQLTRKLVLFPAAVLVLAGGLSGLPTLPSWPLHHGFGGLLGDLLFNMMAAVMAVASADRGGVLASLVLVIMGLVTLVRSFGMSFGDLVGTAARAPSFEGVAERSNQMPEQDQDYEEPLPDLSLDQHLGEEHFDLPDEDVAENGPELAFGPPPAMEEKHSQDLTFADDLAVEEARAFARRFAPATAPKPVASDVDAGADGVGPYKLPAMLRGFSPTRPTGWRRPQLGLLKRPAQRSGQMTPVMLHERAALLVDVLSDFGVQGEVRDVRSGPVVTLFEFQPARGIKTSRIIALADDVARAMSATAARIAAIPGRTTIGIELPNEQREMVLLRDVLDSDAFQSSPAKLPLALGYAIGGEPVVADLARMPHLLVAGTTGSGKSVGVNAMILSLLYKHSPKECRLLLIDPKMLELAAYDGIPHLLAPVVTDPEHAVTALDWAVDEMEERYKRMARLGVRNIEAFNGRVEQAAVRGEVLERTVQTGFDQQTGEPIYERQMLEEGAMAHIVIVVDEFADLMMTAGRHLEIAVQRLAQKARAAGIHLIMATQRPSVDIVTGTIKANFPTRISFRVASKVDSRTILGEAGAEQLLGHGDMLLSGGAGQPLRVHGAYVSEDEVEAVATALKAQGRPVYDAAVMRAPEPPLEPAASDRGRRRRVPRG